MHEWPSAYRADHTGWIRIRQSWINWFRSGQDMHPCRLWFVVRWLGSAIQSGTTGRPAPIAWCLPVPDCDQLGFLWLGYSAHYIIEDRVGKINNPQKTKDSKFIPMRRCWNYSKLVTWILLHSLSRAYALVCSCLKRSSQPSCPEKLFRWADVYSSFPSFFICNVAGGGVCLN